MGQEIKCSALLAARTWFVGRQAACLHVVLLFNIERVIGRWLIGKPKVSISLASSWRS